MKIVIASRKLNSRDSAPKCNVYLASALAKLGHEIHVLTSITAPQACQKLRESHVIIHKTHTLFANKKLSPFAYTLFVHKLKNRFSADIVFGNGYTLVDDVTWVHFSRLAGMKRLGYERWNIRVEAKLEKLLFDTSGFLLAPSSLVAEDLRKLYGLPSSKILVQPHGVDIEYYNLPQERREVGGKAEGKVCLLFVGGYPLRKGFHLLLRSLAGVRSCRDLKLIAVGFNPDLNLQLLVERLDLKKVVSFEGIISTEKLKELYQLSDFYVLPSLYDPFSIATLEAMATGLPAVVSYYTGVKDVLRNWHDAVLIDPLDTKQFTEVLDVLINDEKLRRRMGMNAKLTAERYCWENVAKSTTEIFERILKA